MDRQLIVYVLGAGASARCGYPLAADLFPRLKEYGESIRNNCPLLHSAIEYVVAKANEMGCLTPDDLALQALQRRRGGDKNYRVALNTLSYSRIATDALFRHLETQVTPLMLQRVKGLWHQMVGDSSDDWFGQVPKTNYRLVTFNYDRTAELAFVRFFPALAAIASKDVYGTDILNAGFGSTNLAFGDSRFCFLKLHGTVGVEGFGENEIERLHGDFFRHYAPLEHPYTTPTDDFYFKKELNQEGLPESKFEPLIAFPADRQRIHGGGQDYNFEAYIKAVSKKAEEIFSNAKEIRVIGCSFAAPDKEWLLSLIRRAPNAELIVHNPDAERLCKELKVYDKLQNVTALDEYW
jgi:hypothetical protein